MFNKLYVILYNKIWSLNLSNNYLNYAYTVWRKFLIVENFDESGLGKV